MPMLVRRSVPFKSGIRSVSSYIQRMSTPQPQFSKEYQKCVVFWKARLEHHRSVSKAKKDPWSITDQMKAVLYRRAPLTTSGLFFGYNMGVAGVLFNSSVVVNGTVMTAGITWIGTVLFLMLSFRVNRSTSRYWDGLMEFGRLQSECKSLSRNSQCYMGLDSSSEVTILSYAIARATEYELRRVSDTYWVEYFTPLIGKDSTLSMLKLSCGRPYYLVKQVSKELKIAHAAGEFNIRPLVAMNANLERIEHCLQALDLLQSTPEPWTYQKHLRTTTLIWLGVVPFSLVPAFGPAAVPIGTLMAYIVIKLDDIAMELQDPFGDNFSDLPIPVMNDTLQKTLCSYLESNYQ